MQRLSENNTDGHFSSSLVTKRHFTFGKKPRIQDYDKYLVGPSYTKLKNARRLSKVSIDNYKWYLYHFCKDLGLTTEEIVAMYSKQGQYSIEFQEMVLNHVSKYSELAEKGIIKPQKAAGARSAIRKFSLLNNININWDLIGEYVPPIDSNAKDEAYTIEQIKNILECGIDLRVKIAILFMTSGGLRREAIVELKHGAIKPIFIEDKLIAAKVVAYNDYKQRYATFVTPEAYRTYERYIKQRKRYGELITETSPVIIKKFNVKASGDADIDNSPIASSSLNGLMIDAAVKSGVRKPSPHYKNRYINKSCHAFRKTFESVLLNAKNEQGDLIVNPLIAVRLLGDKVKTELGLGVMDHYRRRDPLQRDPYDPNNEYSSLLHEYKKVIADLTISDEERLLVENRKLKHDVELLNTVGAEIHNIKKEMARQNREIIVLAKKGTKFPPNSRVVILNDLEGNEDSPMVIHTDKNGEIDGLDLDALQEMVNFESMTEEEQIREIERKRVEGLKTIQL